ncbi:MAG: PhzF family phenazine biosynthesis protein [Leptolyngbyaceae bacterium]|nr:PhzF family phenazine biosynthesis protein [Leptolyngbyaceae bacterium]
MALTITQVDAFTDQPFAGNPAAVCVLSTPHPDQWMQAVAREMNLSETAFLMRQADGFSLRWFTPTVEVDLCGHATLASAHVLWSEGHLPLDQPARFHTRSGILTAQRQDDWIELDFPADPPMETAIPIGLEEALGATAQYGGQAQLGYFVIEVESEALVRGLQPNFTELAAIPVKGAIVTSLSQSPDYDFVSRFFAPRFGINEDPVTGSAHCCLAPFWLSRLPKAELIGYQASDRGGVVKVRCQDQRVFLAGQAVTVLQGELVGL